MNEDDLTLLRRMFCCGIPTGEFNAHVQSLGGPDQDRLIRVAKRLQLTHTIRNDISFTTQSGMGEDYEYRIEHLELASLEVYLLITCLDALAGKPDYSQIDHWVRDNLEDRSYTKEEILKKLTEYRESYGPRRTLRTEFINLPAAHQEWINQNIAYLKSGDYPFDEIREQNVSRLLPRLFEYFYDIRRNEYTHSSKTRQTAVNRNPNELFEGWLLSLASWDRKYCLWYRTGLDEATILKVIIHGVVLNKSNIVSNAEAIKAYLNNERRRKVISGFIREIYGNTNQLDWWINFNGNNISGDIKAYLYHAGIPTLNKDWSESFLGIILDVNFERGYRPLIHDYLLAIEFVNVQIENFNQQNMHKQLSWAEKAINITSFFQKLIASPQYKTIIHMSKYKIVGNLLLIRRDPCYT